LRTKNKVRTKKKKVSSKSKIRKSKYGTFAKETSYENPKTGASAPTISLFRKEDDKYPFSFGKKKALLIVLHMKEIEDFVDKNIDMTKVKF
jgi:hypothetical protein